MFSVISLALSRNKYSHAVMRVIVEIHLEGVICADIKKNLYDVAFNDANKMYGIGLIKLGAVPDSYVAGATVFARVCLVAHRAQRKHGSLEASLWQLAGQEALKQSNTNLSDDEAEGAFEGSVYAIDEAEK